MQPINELLDLYSCEERMTRQSVWFVEPTDTTCSMKLRPAKIVRNDGVERLFTLPALLLSLQV